MLTASIIRTITLTVDSHYHKWTQCATDMPNGKHENAIKFRITASAHIFWSSRTWDPGLEICSRHGYSAFLCCCLVLSSAALRRTDPRSKESETEQGTEPSPWTFRRKLDSRPTTKWRSQEEYGLAPSCLSIDVKRFACVFPMNLQLLVTVNVKGLHNAHYITKACHVLCIKCFGLLSRLVADDESRHVEGGG
jgi:hypothetical protein